MNPDIMNQFSAIPTIAGFEFQIYYYLKTLLSLEPEEEASLELHDDVALEDSEKISYFQLKHSISGKSKNLTNRDNDLWKTLHIWVKVIQSKGTLEDQKKWISKSKFVLITNKDTDHNDLVDLIRQYLKPDTDTEKKWNEIENYVSEQANKKNSKENGESQEDKPSKVTSYASTLDKFDLKRELLSSVEVITQSVEELFKDISNILRYSKHVSESRVSVLTEILFGRLIDSFKDTILKGMCSKFTGKSFDEHFGSIFRQYRCQKFITMPFPSKGMDLNKYLSSTFIKQLVDIGDYAVKDNKIVSTITQRLSFENDYNTSKQDISIDEQQAFEKDIHLNWENHFEHYNGCLSDESCEQDIKKSAKDILYQIRNSKVNFVGEVLNIESVYGCYYYFSDGDHPTIGWRSDWKEKYNGEDFRQNGL